MTASIKNILAGATIAAAGAAGATGYHGDPSAMTHGAHSYGQQSTNINTNADSRASASANANAYNGANATGGGGSSQTASANLSNAGMGIGRDFSATPARQASACALAAVASVSPKEARIVPFYGTSYASFMDQGKTLQAVTVAPLFKEDKLSMTFVRAQVFSTDKSGDAGISASRILDGKTLEDKDLGVTIPRTGGNDSGVSQSTLDGAVNAVARHYTGCMAAQHFKM